MKSTIQSIIKYTVWAIIFTASTYVYAAWNEPRVPPPGDNPEAPVNTGSTTQSKTGFLWAQGIGSNAGGYFATTLGVATTTDPTGKSLKALFGGKVGAGEYCSDTGTNCVAGNDVGKATGQVIYLSTWPPYSKTTNFSWSDYYYAQVRTTFTKSELINNIPQIAAETRDILGILVAWNMNFDTNTSADARWYRLQHVPLELDAWPDGYYTQDSYHFYWYPKTAALSGTLDEHGHTTLIDYINNDEYSIEAYIGLSSYTIPSFTVNGSMNYQVIGYIVR